MSKDCRGQGGWRKGWGKVVRYGYIQGVSKGRAPRVWDGWDVWYEIKRRLKYVSWVWCVEILPCSSSLAEVPSSRFPECDPLWENYHWRWDQLRRGPTGVGGGGESSITGVLIKGIIGCRPSERKDVTAQRASPSSFSKPGMPETTRSEGRSSGTDSPTAQKKPAAPTPWSPASVSRAETMTFCFSSHPVCGTWG